MRRLSRIMILVLTLTFFLGILIVPFEAENADPLIKNVFDGVWWAVSTVTTVGYGDLVPLTPIGRLIGILLQLSGAVMFGSLVGTITVYLNHVQEEFHWKRLHEQLERMEQDNKELKNKLDFLIKNKSSSGRSSQRFGL